MPPVFGPFPEGATGVLRAADGQNCPRGTTPFADLVLGSKNPFRQQ